MKLRNEEKDKAKNTEKNVKQKISKSIRFKCMAAINILVITILIASMISTYVISKSTTTDEMNGRFSAMVNNSSAEVENWVEREILLLEELGNDLIFNNNFDKDHLSKLLVATHDSDKSVIRYYVAMEDNKFVSSDGFILPEGFIITERPWYKDTKSSGKTIVSEPYLDAGEDGVVITISTPIIINSNIVGVVGADIKINVLFDMVQSVRIADDAYSFIINRNNDVVIHRELTYNPTGEGYYSVTEIGDFKNNIEYINGNDRGIFKGTDYDNILKHFIFTKIPSLNWTLVSAVPESIYQEPLNALGKSFIIISIISLLTGSIVSILIVDSIIKPIKLMRAVVSRISNHDFSSNEKNTATTNEFYELVENLNSMTNKQRELIGGIKGSAMDINGKNDIAEENINKISDTGKDIERVIEGITEAIGGQAGEMTIILDEMNELSDGLIKIEDGSSNLVSQSDVVKSKNLHSIELINDIKEYIMNNLESAKTLSDQMQDLINKFSNIDKITATITEIANQTDLLALNAAIEAARAGEQGKGFSIVADEVRNLAEQSNSSAEEIQLLVREILGTINVFDREVAETLKSAEKSDEKINNTINEYEDIKKSSDELINHISIIGKEIIKANSNRTQVLNKVETVTALAQEQSAYIEEVNATIQQQTEAISEVGELITNINKLSENLEKMVEVYKV